MNTQIKLFNSPKFGEVRTVTGDSGKALLHATDVAKSLGYENPAEAISTHCKSSNIVKCYVPHTNGIGGVYMQFIPEGEVYRLVMRSKLPGAEEFQDWVCEEVLPAIRIIGGYIATREEDTPETILARAVLVANDSINRLKNQLETKQKQIELQEKELKEQAPKADYYDKVLDSEGLIATTLIAKDLGMSAAALNKKLFAMNIIYRCQKTWVVSAKYQAMGYAKSKSFPFHDQKGELHTQIHFYWTQSGRKFIIERLQKALAS